MLFTESHFARKLFCLRKRAPPAEADGVYGDSCRIRERRMCTETNAIYGNSVRLRKLILSRAFLRLWLKLCQDDVQMIPK